MKHNKKMIEELEKLEAIDQYLYFGVWESSMEFAGKAHLKRWRKAIDQILSWHTKHLEVRVEKLLRECAGESPPKGKK